MFVYLRFPLVLKHGVKEQPGRTMPKNAKDIELHSQKGCLNPSLKVFKPTNKQRLQDLMRTV